MLDALENAKRAAATVLDDLHRTSDLRPEVIVDGYEGSAVRMAVNGIFTVPSITAEPMDDQRALIDAAEYLQGEIADSYYRVWPLCATHEVDMQPKLHERRAWWWCAAGDHGVAGIGELSE